MLRQEDLLVRSLGEPRFPSPLNLASASAPDAKHFRDESRRIRVDVTMDDATTDEPLSFEEAGPRPSIFFDPAETTAAIVTCGGLSPGLNNVIRSVFHELAENYGVRRVLGIRSGFLGMNPDSGLEPVELTRDFAESIDKLGGTVLGSSRGPQPLDLMADYLESREIDILFCLGGDGTQRGAAALDAELRKRNKSVAIVGIPKTIDNDVPFVRLSFGYTTALEKAAEVIRSAHVEARGAVNGIAIVKLMGRHAGFIAAGASIVSQEVDFTLVPEVAFPLDGLLSALENRIRDREHAVIVVAEGAGQHLCNQAGEQQRDASGNLLSKDIGYFLREKIAEYFLQKDLCVSIKYLDPSYHIRSVPANVYDRFLCDQMGRNAVHAAMAGKTGMIVGMEHGHLIHVPIPAVVSQTKRLEVSGDLWLAVLEATHQPGW